MSQHDEDEGLTRDQLLSALTGKCLHEIQLGRIMGVLGLAAAANGGKLVLPLEGLKELDGVGIGIAIDEAAGTATVELVNGASSEGLPTPTHAASTSRH